MNVLEQTRELGLLRIVAMTKKQVRRTILMQALIIGGVGLPPGILLGVGVAYVINLAMMPSFGHPVKFELHPGHAAGHADRRLRHRPDRRDHSRAAGDENQRGGGAALRVK